MQVFPHKNFNFVRATKVPDPFNGVGRMIAFNEKIIARLSREDII